MTNAIYVFNWISISEWVHRQNMNAKVLTNGHYDKPLVSTNQKNVKGAHLARR